MTSTLIVMLPGALMAPQDFLAAGFADALAQYWPEATLMPASIDVNQLDVAACVATLREQLLSITAQYPQHQLILGGISLGAAIAMYYTRQYAPSIAGLCLLAPYPGSRMTTQAIRTAGGPATWQLSDQQRQDDEFLFWDWIIHGHKKSPLYLGYGRSDRLADRLDLMAEAMPTAICHTMDGDHDWPTWQALWQDFIARRHSFVLPNTTGTH